MPRATKPAVSSDTTESGVITTAIANATLPEGATYRVLDDEEGEEGDQTIEFTIPIPGAPAVVPPAEQWTDAQLFAVKKYGPAIIGEEMYAAVQRRIKATGDGKLGPALTLDADEHTKAVAAHEARLAERALEVQRRQTAVKIARQQAYEHAMNPTTSLKPVA